MTPAQPPFSVLIAEDDEDDQYLLKKAFEANQIPATPIFVANGQDMMDRLDQDSPLPLPNLVLLDLNMPRMDGRQALKKLKQDERLKKIPVVVLTTSDDPDDVIASYSNGANSFFTKPVDFGELVGLVGLLENYWLKRAELPG